MRCSLQISVQPLFHNTTQEKRSINGRHETEPSGASFTEGLISSIVCETFDSNRASPTNFPSGITCCWFCFSSSLRTIKSRPVLLFRIEDPSAGHCDLWHPECTKGSVNLGLTFVLQVFHLHSEVLCMVTVDPMVSFLCFFHIKLSQS